MVKSGQRAAHWHTITFLYINQNCAFRGEPVLQSGLRKGLPCRQGRRSEPCYRHHAIILTLHTLPAPEYPQRHHYVMLWHFLPSHEPLRNVLEQALQC